MEFEITNIVSFNNGIMVATVLQLCPNGKSFEVTLSEDSEGYLHMIETTLHEETQPETYMESPKPLADLHIGDIITS